ncbi:zinc dependent phospholipase C family protein [Pseudoalteromonas sp. PPB1]|uniref:zinc dependent phospholipase C family protein n=1 Tax=Pseudoalteromonas sp. PPB1 TaxID=2756136 RepID=UPI001890BA57|nr:hypothetical protein [Pseudoalteromonas sp. PPB1]
MKFFKFLFFLSALVSNMVAAFELKTHMYVGKEVINDLRDHKVSIPPYGDFAVNKDLASAILANQNLYLLGTNGPDVLPDFIGGQVTVHAGTGWNSNQWLTYLSTKPDGISSSEWSAFYSGYLSHAASDVFAHTYVNSYAGDAFDLGDSDAFAVEIRHKLLEMYISKYQPYSLQASSVLNVSSNQIKAIKEKLLDNDGVSAQYKKSTFSKHLQSMKAFEDEAAEQAKPLGILKRTLESWINISKQRQKYYNDLIAAYEKGGAEREEQQRNISRLEEEIKELNRGNIGNYVVCELLPFSPSAFCPSFDDPFRNCKDADEYRKEQERKGLCLWSDDHARRIVDELKKKEDELARLKSELKSIWDSNPELKKTAKALGIKELSKNEAVQALALVTTALALGYELDVKAIALDAAYSQFFKYSVEKAGEAYISANISTAKLIADGKNYTVSAKPITEWLACYGPIYTGDPIGTVTPHMCEAAKKLKNLQSQLSESLKDLAKDHNGLASIYSQYNQIKKDINALSERIGKHVVKEILNDDQEKMLRWISNPPSDDVINNAFKMDGLNKKLLLIPDVSERIKGDMHLKNGKFSPQEFAPVYNAIQLSKLALLGKGELNRLARKAGVDIRHVPNSNIMLGWIASLDGNHAWMERSPKLPRQHGHEDQKRDYERQYSVRPFYFWGAEAAREQIFLRIFKGPLAPGLVAADTIGESNILPDYYKIRNCHESAFQLDQTHFERCLPIAAWLIPILSVIN